MTFLKPPRLQLGDTVAAISLSCGLGGQFPQVYEAAKRTLKEMFGLELIQTPNALRDDDWLYQHPEARADDLHWALQNPEVKGIFSTIGGYESVRILPFVKPELIRAHPKVLLGYSDTTVTHLAFLRAGITTLYGPSLMSGFADMTAFPYAQTWAKRLLTGWYGLYEASERWTEDLSDWNTPDFSEAVAQPKTFHPGGWRWLQGEGRTEGHLIGGCMEVLEMLKGTRYWPEPELWQGAVIFLEASDTPSVDQSEYWLRNYATQGILGEAAALLIARPRGYTSEMKVALEQSATKVLAEVGREAMPVVMDMDIGHTSPMMTLPLGCRVAVDPVNKTVELLEPAVL
jgi:muramoyltetrapeptide carboxypeptidase LdcA involved in peptidoglycan recycling